MAAVFSFFAYASSPLGVIEGCQGEGCDCFDAYRSEKTKTRIESKTIRPFTLYKEMSRNSKQLGKFSAGVMAKPIKSQAVVLNNGSYSVAAVKNIKLPLKVGQLVDTLWNEGEGYSRVRSNGKWISFDASEITLVSKSDTVLDEWLEISTGKLRGYTQDSPFEGCLE